MMITPPITLGPFELAEPVGRGGMAEVWRGIHPEQQARVAVKVMTVAQARNRKYIEAFRNEVQAVAALYHPGIILVLDYGEVPPEAEARSGGRLVAGSPYLVMELAGRGSLDRHEDSTLDWSAVRTVVLALLDSLAHAHARGVVHRDIKPGNVLLCSSEDPRPGLKLTDFGIAHADERRGTSRLTEGISGTPAYMAPEQIKSQVRDLGPWTDLYAVGCLAYELLTGKPPFHGKGLLQTAIAHLMEPPPPLRPRVPVPDGVVPWVMRLLEKDPADRFLRCADAAWALLALDTGEASTDLGHELTLAGTSAEMLLPTLVGTESGLETTLVGLDPTEIGSIALDTIADDMQLDVEPHELDTQLSADSRATLQTIEEMEDSDDPELPEAATLPEICPRPLPPMPPTWRRRDSGHAPMQLVGAGLGLYGLRSIPLVDREAPRDRIWEALTLVRRESRARLILLEGVAGVGKSRLVEWMCERAHEVGAALVLRAVHGPKSGATQGLSSMVARHLHCRGLDRAGILERLEEILGDEEGADEYERTALAELISPSPPDAPNEGGPIIRFGSPVERYVLVQRLLEREGRERPVIVWFDDVHWGADSVAFAAHVLAAQAAAPCPVLFLLTAREEALAEQVSESRMLDELLRLPSAEKLHLPPLLHDDHSVLVRGLLGLEGDLAADVEKRTSGNPLFAVQLIGDWVQRGVLQVAKTGFVLKPGERAVLPDDIHQVWHARLDRLLDGEPQQSTISVELAAVLGRQIDLAEWRVACGEMGFAPRESPLEILLGSRLLQREDDGYSFVHGMLRECLERSAREAGRWSSLNAACARMLKRCYPLGTRGAAERLGRHLVEAGELAAALEPLLKGAREHRTSGDFRAAMALLDLREQALATLRVPGFDPRWGEGWCLRAAVHHNRGQVVEADGWARKALAAAEEHGWQALVPRTVREIGNIAQMRGALDEARSHYVRAEMLSRGDAAEHAYSVLGLANVSQRSGELERATQLYSDALVTFEGVPDETGMAKCLCGMSLVARQLGDQDRSDRLTHRATDLFERAGNQSGQAECWNALAEASRFRGDFATAEEGYRKALRLMEAIGSGDDVIVRINLGLVLLARGRYPAAHTVLDAALALLEARGRHGLLGCVHAEHLPCAAAIGDWRAWDEHYESAMALLAQTPMVDPDIAWPTQLGGDLAAAAGEPRRARSAYELSLTQWRALGLTQKIVEVERSLAALPRS